ALPIMAMFTSPPVLLTKRRLAASAGRGARKRSAPARSAEAKRVITLSRVAARAPIVEGPASSSSHEEHLRSEGAVQLEQDLGVERGVAKLLGAQGPLAPGRGLLTLVDRQTELALA